MPGTFAGLTESEIRQEVRLEPKRRKRIRAAEVVVTAVVVAWFLFGSPGSIGF